MADYSKPLPLVDSDSAPYWEGTKAHQLRAQRCSGCGQLRWPPRGFCPHCWSWEATWQTLPETGAVVSYVVVHQATNPVFAQDVPYTVANVQLDAPAEAVILTANLLDVPWQDVKVGLRVRAFYDDVTPEVTLPKFRPE